MYMLCVGNAVNAAAVRALTRQSEEATATSSPLEASMLGDSADSLMAPHLWYRAAPSDYASGVCGFRKRRRLWRYAKGAWKVIELARS